MHNARLFPRHTAHESRGGFTLVELLVVIGIIAILAGVALGPITRGIKQAQESGSMQTCRQIGLMEFAYSNDNSQVYPFGAASAGGSETVENALLNGNYATDPNVFYIKSTPNSATPVAAASGVFTEPNGACSYDFLTTSGTSGLTSTAADGTPLCELTGGTYSMTSPGPLNATIAPASSAFGSDGIAVTYKSNNAVFLKCAATSATVATSVQPILSASYTDSNATNYKFTLP